MVLSGWSFVPNEKSYKLPSIAITSARLIAESRSPSISKVSLTEFRRGAEFTGKIPFAKDKSTPNSEIKPRLGFEGIASASKTSLPLQPSFLATGKHPLASNSRKPRISESPLSLQTLLAIDPRSTSPRIILPKSLQSIPTPEQPPLKNRLRACQGKLNSLTGTQVLLLSKRPPQLDEPDMDVIFKGVEAGLLSWADIKIKPSSIVKLCQSFEAVNMQ